MADAPNKWAKWTDAEDAVVDLFPAAEAAELLGRTYQAVRSRRHQKGLGPPHGDRKGKDEATARILRYGTGTTRGTRTAATAAQVPLLRAAVAGPWAVQEVLPLGAAAC